MLLFWFQIWLSFLMVGHTHEGMYMHTLDIAPFISNGQRYRDSILQAVTASVSRF